MPIKISFTDSSNISIGTDTTLTKITYNSCDAGIASQQIFKGNGYVTFKVSAGASAMIGLSGMNSNDHFNTIEYALYAHSSNKLLVYHQGQSIAEIGDYDDNAILNGC